MDRRDFMAISIRDLALLSAVPGLASCSTLAEAFSDGNPAPLEFDPGAYEVGDLHLVFDGSGPAYALDLDEHQLSRVDRTGRPHTELAEFGTDRGDVNHPIDAAVGPDGRLYVLDAGNHRVQVFGPDGRHLASFGDFHLPKDLVIAGDSIFVCDTLNHRVLVFDLDGNPRHSFGDDLNGPRSVAVDSGGDVHVLDADGVHVFSASGSPVRTYAEAGRGRVAHPRSIASIDGLIFVADPSAASVHVFGEDGRSMGDFRPLEPTGERAVPFRLTARPSGGIYIWTGGHDTFETLAA